jgi:hypothetical protein
MTTTTAAPSATPTTGTQPTAAPAAPDVKADAGKPDTKGKASEIPDFEDDFVIDGKPQKLKYSEAKARLQKELAADKRFEEASKLSQEAKREAQQAKQIIDSLKSKDRKLLEQVMGADGLVEWAEQLVWEKLQKEKMTPEQKRILELEEKTKQYEETESQAKEREAQEKQHAMIEQYKQHYSRKISQAIEASNLPKDATTVALMASILDSYRVHNYEPTNEELIEAARTRYDAPVKSYVPTMSGEQLVKWLGPEVVAKIREFDLSQLKNPLTKRPDQPVQQQGGNSREDRQFKTPSELAREVKRRLGVG